MATTLPHSLILISGGTSSSASDLLKSKSNFVNGVPFNTSFWRGKDRLCTTVKRVGGTSSSASYLLKSKSNFVNGVPFNTSFWRGKDRLCTTVKRVEPPPVPIWKGIGEGIGKGIEKGIEKGKGLGKGFGKGKEKKKQPDQSLTPPVVTDPNAKGGFLRRLSDFQPLKEKPKPVSLNFEKPLLELEKKINEVRKMAEQTGLDFTEQILSLQSKYDKALKDLYTNLTPIQRVYIARHPQRPTFLDHVFNMTDKFIELHGDRAGYDDPAIVTGLGKIDGRTYMFIGQQKGRNSKENIKRNFGMPTPHGYRKALRMMRYADEHKFPIITFVDTPGAYADLKSEELGQGEAIAYNLKAMFGLKVPVVSIVIGEGGSGGALGIACGNKLLMLENAVFYVASPEACAAILFKSAAAAPLAAARLKITAPELCRMKIADGIIPEPLGGAHVDPAWTSQQIKIAVTAAMDELLKMDTPQLLHDRWLKFRNVGKYKTIEPEQMSLITQKKELLTGIKQKPFVQKEISKAKEISEKFGAAELADVKRKVEALNADIVSAQANGDGDMEKELKEKLKKVEVEMKMAIRTSLLGEKKAVRIARVLSKYLSDGKKKIEELKVEISNARTKGNRDSEKKLQEELATFEAEMKLKQVKVLNSSLLNDKKIGRVSKALVIDLPEAQKKIKALKADIASARAGRNGDLEKQLQEKLMKMEEESKLKKLQVLKSTLRGFNKVRETSNSLVSDPSDVKGKIEALKALKADLASARTNGDGDLEQKLEEKLLKMATEMNSMKSQLHNSSLMNGGKVRKTADAELTEEMKTLDQRIKKKLAEVKASSAVGDNENGSAYDDGSAVGINIGTNQEHS